MDYLRRLLDYASGLILKLGSPARDSPAKAAHESLIKELSTVSSGSKDTQTDFFTTLVKGLRFIFEQLQVRSLKFLSKRTCAYRCSNEPSVFVSCHYEAALCCIGFWFLQVI